MLLADVHAARADTVVGPVPVASGITGRAEVLIRPEDVSLETGDAGVVELVEFYGHDTVYVVRANDGSQVRSRRGAAPTFARGDRVSLRYTGGTTAAFQSVAADNGCQPGVVGSSALRIVTTSDAEATHDPAAARTSM